MKIWSALLPKKLKLGCSVALSSWNSREQRQSLGENTVNGSAILVGSLASSDETEQVEDMWSEAAVSKIECVTC